MALYEIIQWPEIQELMDIEGFRENSYLVNDEQGINEYGSSAYFVNKTWLDKATDAHKQIVYIVSTLTESRDETPNDYHNAFANFMDAVSFRNKEVEHCMRGKDINENEVINDFQTLYEWRSDTVNTH